MRDDRARRFCKNIIFNPEFFTKLYKFRDRKKGKPMNKNIIKTELQSLMEAINEQFEVLKEHENKISRIEYDIIFDNIRKLYENLHRLQRLEDPFDNLERRKNESVTQKPLPPVQPVEKIKPRKTVEPEMVKEVIHKQTAKKSLKSPDEDLFAGEEPMFSIKLKEARDKSLGPKGTPEKTPELKTLIGINEKFMFINELFDGNLREYNETIDTLNGLQSLNQASEYLDILRKKNFWDTGSQAFKKLSEIVNRKF